MVIIDPEGMFGGDRMAKLTDQARLYWPWFYLASNGFARIEINYRRLLARVFSGFLNPPSEDEVMTFIREYRDAYLLFPYVANGQLWGQWDTQVKFLPRHKRSSDHQSPEPPIEEWIAWKNEYAACRTSQVPSFATISEIRRNPPKSAEIVQNIPRVGVDVVVGVDAVVVEKNICTSDDVRVCEPTVFELGASRPSKRERERWFYELFWPVVWAKIGKGAAYRAWMNRVHTLEFCQRLVAAAKEQGPGLVALARQQGRQVIHPATWLNAERYDDEEVPGVIVAPAAMTRQAQAVEASRRSLREVDLGEVETAY